MANQTFTLNIKALFDASKVKSEVNSIQSTLSKLKMPDKLTADLKNSFVSVNKALDDFINKTEKGVKTKADATGITKSFDVVTKELNKLDALLAKVQSEVKGSTDLSKIIKIDDKAKSDIAKLSKDIADIQKEINKINTSKLQALQTALSQIKTKGAKEHGQHALDLFEQGDVESAIQELDKIINKLSSLKNQTQNVVDSTSALRQMKQEMVDAQTENAQHYSDINDKIGQQAQIAQNATANVVSELNKEAESLNDITNAANNTGSAINELTARQAQFVREIDQVKSRIQYFFGISNAINLIKRAVRDAVTTIKDLDKAMTETAVVTDFTVSDMWKQLPEYTKRANELGVTTQAAYEAATLYYQQGLNNDEVNALSVETLKMARIAGLDAAEATDRMTNALRGFNMALDERSAQRVDDVYSELAANTASNVDEISTAMTKVASLAHSANMEFETTAAFLAQIIETTRESAETAGTALKTVVARFSEVKKLVDTNKLKGTDEEGQAIDVNKVGAALRTAGVDLNKYFLGEVGLDDIFMELASKWDTLTSVQQRYIATQAAGSRQQSRFIALMQDYARTQELVGRAYNAEGASAKQFAKTQESLQSKLARLKNAWDQFLMGLTNNAMVKTVVDILTALLNLVNKITNAFGEGVGTVLKWAAALSSIAGLRSLFSDGGLGTRAIGHLLGQGLVSNKIRAALGLGTFNDEGIYQANTKQKTRTRIFGTGGLFSNLGQKIQDFKAGSLTPAYDNYAKLSPAEKIRFAASNPVPSAAVPKTLFGALGNRFIKTGVGSSLQSGLSKLPGIGSAFSGAAAGAATLAATLGMVAAAAGVVYAAWRASPAGQLQKAQKIAEKAKSAAEESKKEFQSLNDLQDTYKEKTNEIELATTASDRRAAIEARNEAVLAAIESNGSLAKYVVTEVVDNEIQITVDEQALADAIKNASDTLKEAEIKSGFADATVGLRQADVYEDQLRTLWIRSTKQNRSDVNGINLTPEEYLNAILKSSAKPEDISKATSLFNQITSARAAAENQAQLSYAKQLQGITKDSDLINALLPMLGDIFTRTGKQLSNDQLQGIIDIDGIKHLADVYNRNIDAIDLRKVDLESEADLNKVLGLTEDQFKALSTATGLSIKTIKAHIKAIAEDTKQTQQMQSANIYQKAFESKIPLTEQFQEQVNNLSPELLQSISSILDQAEGTITSSGMAQLINSMLDMDTQSLNQVKEFYQGFDLNKPIQAFHQLKQAKEGALELPQSFQNLLPEIEKVNAALFDTGNLVQSFLLSESYETMTDSLSKFIDENGRLSASNIEELAESCEELQMLIDDTTVSAEGLAEAFNAFETAGVAIDGITTSLLEALSAGESFESLIGHVSDWIKEFDQGTDLTEGTEHIVSELETLTEYVTKWQFGNEPTENIYDHFFGKGAYDNFMKGKWGPDKSVEKIATEMQGQIDKLSGLAENNGLGFMQQVVKTGLAKGLHITQLDQEGYNFKWDLTEFNNAQEAIQGVQQALMDLTGAESISEDTARAFIEGVGAQFYDMRQDWNELNYKGELQAFAQSVQQNSVITQSELAALGAATDRTAEQVLADLQSIAGEGVTIPIVVDWSDGNGGGLTGQALIDEFNEKFSSIPKDINGHEMTREYGNLLQGIFDEASGAINADALMQRLTQELKLSPNQATQIADNITKTIDGKLTKEIEVPVVTKVDDNKIEVTSQTITIESDSMEGLTSVADQALANANANIVGQALASGNYEGLTGSVESALATAGEAGATAIKGSIEAIHPDIGISWHWEGGAPNISGPTASGGIVQSYASGSANNRVSPGIALTGEEGPEIVWNKEKGYAYITGENHPELQDLQPGDRVFNAQETRKILKGSFAKGGIIGSWASGGWNPSAVTKKSSGGGGGSKSSGSDKEKTPEEWKNELDWLYNLMEDIAELERDQKAIEEQYEDLLQDQNKTGKDLYNLLIKQLGNLYTQLNHQTFALEKREQEMREFMDVTNDKDQYLWYNWQDRTLEIDWDAIDQITDEEEYKHVKELVDEAEEIQDKIDDADDAIMDITNQIQELENIWRDTFTDFEDRVYDAIVKSYQQVIDNYSELNDTLNNSNSQILDSLQKQISLQRQIRDNTKTEEEITDDEARLAYLRRDTTGGNDLAALQLEKELADQRQSYEDSLVDQAISRLQEDNDAAAQQRQQQIDIMQAQLDYQSQNGEFNAAVRELLESAMGGDGELLTNSDLVDLLKEQENWAAMSDVSKDVWEEELNGTFKEVAAFILKQNAEENGTFYTALTKAVESVSSAIGSYSQAMTKLGNQISSAASSGGGGGGGGGGSSSGGYTPSGTPQKDPQSASTTPNAFAKASGGYDYNGIVSTAKTAQQVAQTARETAVKASQVANAATKLVATSKASGTFVGGRANGGIVEQTGLAMLHGTVKEPEYVLNARQTEGFLKLAEVLPSFANANNTLNSSTFGGSTFNVSVNVDNISSDYDVDRMVDRIKEKLYDDASYRNVNTLSFMR